MKWWKPVLVLVGVLVLALAVWLFGPWGDPDLSATPDPAVGYIEADLRIKAVTAEESTHVPEIAERGRSFALLHGSETATAVVVLHGYTSSPLPFYAIAAAYYESGCNVWVPRGPEHGYADYLTDAQADITAQDLRDWADDAVDVAAGLGKKVIVVGQSGGGAMALWAAAERAEVAEAVAIAPFVHPRELPVWLMRPLGRLSNAGLLRSMWRWHDPVLQGSPERQKIDPNAYPRANNNAIGEYLTVGRWLKDVRVSQDATSAPISLLVNEYDPVVDGEYNVALARALAGATGVRVVTVPASAKLGHDLVDSQGENREKSALAYRYLSEVLGLEVKPLPR